MVERLKRQVSKYDFEFLCGCFGLDSAKTMGLPIDVEIYDSQETKTVLQLLSTVSVTNSKCVIGPPCQSNAETTAQLLKINNVPVISPLSLRMWVRPGNCFKQFLRLDGKIKCLNS
jgi:hypothetical protein